MSMRLRSLAAVVLGLVVALSVGCASGNEQRIDRLVEARVASPRLLTPTRWHYDSYRDRIEYALQRELAYFYPAAVDAERGGFRHALPADWAKMDGEARRKGIVYQARLMWTAAEVARVRPELKETYLPYARHGFEFLRERLWDGEHGGFFWVVDEAGEPVAELTDKHAYGQAFGIYAAATYYLASGDEAALDLAMEAFRWLEKNGHDAKNGGYFEAFTRQGEVIRDAAQSYDVLNPNDLIGIPYGFKSMNGHIHLMEALTVLATARPEDKQVRRRLDEVFLIVRDRMAVRPGCLHLVFSPEWRPAPMYDSFGHNVETAFLLYEADTLRNGRPNSKTRMVAKMLVDQPLRAGWDEVMGGFYYEGFATGKAHVKDKHWWTQAEGLNALLLMHEAYGAEDLKYWRAFCEQWEFIETMQIDPKTGGWYGSVRPWGAVGWSAIMDRWKANYHSVRAMLHVCERLDRLMEQASVEAVAGGAAVRE